MQLSIKTPPELTLPVLEKCAALGATSPSHFAGDCAFQCIKWMGKGSPLPRAQPPAFGLYGLRAGNRLVFVEPVMAKDLGIAARSHVCLPFLLLRKD